MSLTLRLTGSHSVTSHPTQVNTARLNTSQAGTRFTYPGGWKAEFT